MYNSSLIFTYSITNFHKNSYTILYYILHYSKSYSFNKLLKKNSQ